VIGVERLHAAARLRITEVAVAGLERGAEQVGSRLEHESMAPAHGEDAVLVAALRAPGAELVAPRFGIRGDEPLELAAQRVDHFGREDLGHDDVAEHVEGNELLGCRAAVAESEGVEVLGAHVDGHDESVAGRCGCITPPRGVRSRQDSPLVDAFDDPEVDPGWELSPRLLLFLVPGYLMATNKRGAGQRDGLSLVRQVWVSFTGAVVLFGLVLVFVTGGSDVERTSPVPWLAAVLAATLVGQVAVSRILARTLPCDSLSSLADHFRKRFFLATACSEAPCLLAFVGAMVTYHGWLYWAAMPFCLLGFWRNAPTTTHLRREQELLALRGCSLSLVGALRTPTEAR
jgi:hypothetical protein